MSKLFHCPLLRPTTGFLLAVCLPIAVPTAASAAPLDPLAFAPVGDGDFDPGSDVLVDTTALTMSGAEVATGVDAGGIAVFTFDTFLLPAGVTVEADGDRPLALLSKSGMVIGGTIDVSPKEPIRGAEGGPGGGDQAEGPGAGQGPATGGGFGGAGGSIGVTPGGSPYGDLLVLLEGGSGGGGPLGGGGGGALELGATGPVTLGGTAVIDASGSVLSTLSVAGGGGSGGAVLIHTATPEGVDLLSGALIDASGSTGRVPESVPGVPAAGGGGGRVVIVGEGRIDGTIDVSGGSGRVSFTGVDDAYSGEAGTVRFSAIAGSSVGAWRDLEGPLR